MALDMGISIKRYLPPKQTAGLQRVFVSGSSRVPFPPARIIVVTQFISTDILDFIGGMQVSVICVIADLGYLGK